MALIREGTCNHCGQCCGADGSPNQANPWPINFLTRLENMPDWLERWPHGQIAGLGIDVDGKPILLEPHGEIKIIGPNSGVYPYVWINGQPCKDISPDNDGSIHSLECPLLQPDPGDGTRPCGLVGTKYEQYFDIACDDNDSYNITGIPPLIFGTQEQVDLWAANHPLCSFVWR